MRPDPIPSSLRALIVSYSFPPVGGAGVARVLKLVKYLPQWGVRPTVLTVKNPSVPVIDASLEADVPRDLEVLRARTFEPGYGLKKAGWQASVEARPSLLKRALRVTTAFGKAALVPDSQVLWQPSAQAALARRLLGASRDDVVFISGPPFSQFLLAPLARTRAAVVLDYRDEWSTYRTTYEMMGRFGATVGEALEPLLLRSAHAVTLATEEFRKNLLARNPGLDPERVVAIPNGYDPDDIPEHLPAPPTDRFVLSYAGTVFKLTSAQGLLRALRRLHVAEPALAQHLEVRFMGRIVDTERAWFEGAEQLGVRILGYQPHGKVLGELGASHQVLCILDEVPGVERIYPGKIFELMALGRPCLILSPPGALTALAEAHRFGDVVPPRDEAAIAGYLAEKLRAFRAGTLAPPPPPEGIERYDRRALAGEFAGVFRRAVEARRQGRTLTEV